MCFFITIAVPNAAVDEVRRRAAGNFHIEVTANASAIAAAGGAGGAGRMPLLVTAGGCSCAWYQRLRGGGAHAAAERQKRAEARYRRLGWSEAKIGRALASMGASRQPEPGDGLHQEIVEFISELADAHGEVAVWVHDFTGKVESEQYAITERIECSAAELKDLAGTVALDVMVLVRRRQGRGRQSADG